MSHSTCSSYVVVLATAGLLAALPAAAALPADYVVDVMTDSVDVMPGDGMCMDAAGFCSLRAAVQEANAVGGRSIIELAPGGMYMLSLGFAGENLAAVGDLDITAEITLRGRGATIDAGGIDRAFDVRPAATLNVMDVTITNGFVNNASGGGLRTEGVLRVHRSTVTGNSAIGTGASGGAILNSSGYLEVVGSMLSGNDATRAGGAIEASAGTTNVVRSTLSENTTGAVPGNGGALHSTGPAIVFVTSSLIEGNTASLEGGGLWNSSLGSMTIDDCEIVGNIALGAAADDGGGGVFNDGGAMTVTDSTIMGNTALMGSGSGGGVFNNAGDLYLVRTLVDGNSASRAGGGVEALAGYTAVIRSTLSNNSTGPTPGNGGGLHLTGAGDVYVAASDVLSNTATAEGGGLWNSADGVMQVVNTDVVGNRASGAPADQGGGGLFNAGGELWVEACMITDNVADGAAGSGGGVFNDLGVTVIERSTIARNTSVRAGGGLEANVGMTSLTEVVFDGNSTGASPGNGGGVHLTGAGWVGVDMCTLTFNSASNAGGALWNSSTGTMEVNSSSGRGNTAPIGRSLYNDGGTFLVNGQPFGAP